MLRKVDCSDLAAPNEAKEFILATNASENGIGAVLSQKVDGSKKPLAHASKA